MEGFNYDKLGLKELQKIFHEGSVQGSVQPCIFLDMHQCQLLLLSSLYLKLAAELIGFHFANQIYLKIVLGLFYLSIINIKFRTFKSNDCYMALFQK